MILLNSVLECVAIKPAAIVKMDSLESIKVLSQHIVSSKFC